MSIIAIPSARRRVLAGSVLAIVLVEAVLLRHYLARSLDPIMRARPGWLLAAVAAELMSMGAFARLQRRMVHAGGSRVSMVHMIGLVYTANAVNMTFPGGTALSSGFVIKRLRSWGVTGPVAGFTLVASAVLSAGTFAVLALTCAVLAGHGGSGSLLTLGAVGVVVGLLVVGRRQRPGRSVRLATRSLVRFNRMTRRDPDAGVAALQDFAAELGAIKPRGRDWFVGIAFAALNWIADLACLIASGQAVGMETSSLSLMLTAYVAGMTASSISVLPGGFGVIDVAMVFALAGGGVSATSATAGVLLYRVVSCALVVALGWLVWFGGWVFARSRLVDSPPLPARLPSVVG